MTITKKVILKGKDILQRIETLEKIVNEMQQVKNTEIKQEKQPTTIIVSPPEMPVINLSPQIVIEQLDMPAPIVNIPVQPVNLTVEFPDTEEIITVERDKTGFIQALRKRIQR